MNHLLDLARLLSPWLLPAAIVVVGTAGVMWAYKFSQWENSDG